MVALLGDVIINLITLLTVITRPLLAIMATVIFEPNLMRALALTGGQNTSDGIT